MMLFLFSAVHYGNVESLPVNVSQISNNTVVDYNNNSSTQHIAFVLFSIGMVFGPHIGYTCQLYEMYQTSNVEGYSPLVSFILLVSNSIRILYFIGRQYALALLFQSIFAVIVHFSLLTAVMHIVHSSSNGAEDFPPRSEMAVNDIITVDGYSTGFILTKLNNWMVFLEETFYNSSPSFFLKRYLMWSFVITIYVLLFYLSMAPLFDGAPEVIGYIALGLESLLVLPQILRNFRRQSTEGLTMILILTWCIGDIVKVIYFVLDNQPFPFIFCGGFQLFLDVIVIAQVVYYNVKQRQVRILAGRQPTLDRAELETVSPKTGGLLV